MQSYIDKYYKIIANNIKKIRLDNKLSQEAFAEKLGCSREYISRLENYKEHISQQMLLQASFIFKVNPEYFYIAHE